MNWLRRAMALQEKVRSSVRLARRVKIGVATAVVIEGIGRVMIGVIVVAEIGTAAAEATAVVAGIGGRIGVGSQESGVGNQDRFPISFCI